MKNDEQNLTEAKERAVMILISSIIGFISACFVCGLGLPESSWVIWLGTLLGIPFVFSWVALLWPMGSDSNE